MLTNYHTAADGRHRWSALARDRRARAGRLRRQRHRRPASAAPADAGPCGTTDRHHADRRAVRHLRLQGERASGTPYKKVCPNITIKEDVVEQSADYWTRLKTRLASGSGLDDVQAIEIGFVADVVQNHADQFVNWNDVPERRRGQGRVLRLEVAAGQRPATARRPSASAPTSARRRSATASDLLEQAGLPSDPQTLAKKWATWDDFIDFGKQYEASTTKPAGSHFVDSAASIFSTAVYQGDEAYANADGDADVENSDGVQDGLGATPRQAAQDGITAGLQQFSPTVEQGVLQRRVRGARLPDLDDGLHPGPGRRRLRRQVGHRPGAARRRDQLGRLVARRARPTAKNKAAAIALVEWLSAKDQQVDDVDVDGRAGTSRPTPTRPPHPR